MRKIIERAYVSTSCKGKYDEVEKYLNEHGIKKVHRADKVTIWEFYVIIATCDAFVMLDDKEPLPMEESAAERLKLTPITLEL